MVDFFACTCIKSAAGLTRIYSKVGSPPLLSFDPHERVQIERHVYCVYGFRYFARVARICSIPYDSAVALFRNDGPNPVGCPYQVSPPKESRELHWEHCVLVDLLYHWPTHGNPHVHCGLSVCQAPRGTKFTIADVVAIVLVDILCYWPTHGNPHVLYTADNQFARHHAELKLQSQM